MSSDPALILHFAPGTCARVPLIALEEIGTPFETRLVAFVAGEHRKPAFLTRNPAGKVPVLEVDGAVLTQNVAILMWLARRFPGAALLPIADDPMSEAQLLSRLAWFSADLHPIVTRIRMPHFFCDADGAPERVRALGMEAMRFQLGALERDLSVDPWVLGERWSVLDAYLFWIWFRISGAGFETSAFPAISAHHARMASRPATQRALGREEAAQDDLRARGLTVPLN